ncbi:Uncharacterised protein [Kluyvera intermedia]|nr:Uncharacterised protein [Kluyvera intermedia]
MISLRHNSFRVGNEPGLRKFRLWLLPLFHSGILWKGNWGKEVDSLAQRFNAANPDLQNYAGVTKVTMSRT